MLEAQTAEVVRHFAPATIPVSDFERARFKYLLPHVDEVIDIMQASSFDKKMDRFQTLMRHIDDDLYDLGVPMPSNAEGEAALYMRLTELRRLMDNGMLEIARMPLE